MDFSNFNLFDANMIAIVISVIALFFTLFVFFNQSVLKKAWSEKSGFSTRPLQLGAYERLVLLCERIALPNLISRTSQPGLTAIQMQLLLIESLKQEFEYNASQQVYVSQTAWNAVQALRDQTLLTINSIAKSLPPDASASELSRQLLEAIMSGQEKSLHTLALETLNREAKSLMN